MCHYLHHQSPSECAKNQLVNIRSEEENKDQFVSPKTERKFCAKNKRSKSGKSLKVFVSDQKVASTKKKNRDFWNFFPKSLNEFVLTKDWLTTNKKHLKVAIIEVVSNPPATHLLEVSLRQISKCEIKNKTKKNYQSEKDKKAKFLLCKNQKWVRNEGESRVISTKVTKQTKDWIKTLGLHCSINSEQ